MHTQLYCDSRTEMKASLALLSAVLVGLVQGNQRQNPAPLGTIHNDPTKPKAMLDGQGSTNAELTIMVNSLLKRVEILESSKGKVSASFFFVSHYFEMVEHTLPP